MGEKGMKHKFLIKYQSEAYIQLEDDNVEDAKWKVDDIVFKKGIDTLHQDYVNYEIIEVEEIPEWAI